MNNATIAVLITCYNRCNITLYCLQALYQQNVAFNVYLVDDGSSDGTADIVKANYPLVNILKGNGNLFWVGGMHLAFSEALKRNYDYYLWLNDDTILDANALSKLQTTHHQLVEKGYPNSIIVGSTRDAISGKPTYGGAVKSKIWYSNKYEFVQPSQELQECDTMYGNCVLIPNSVAEKVGNLDPAFIHTLGDLDYGLRARQLDCSVWIAPGYVGTCSKNSVRGSWVDTKLSVHERLNKILQIKGYPIRAWTVFVRRHSGNFWFLYWILPYLRAIIGYKNLNESPAFTEETQQQNSKA
ncbi:glycosyltransferase family 2 protein [Calothrix sp. PCC 7507]|uniref:glycosyltransferase family 2 protein n=1 Tax=Calothrix sp. PCC 7507 TaxID=99598 RepID=UPI00029F3C7F|nr:glycosyltransferase family 2 protein [Calothrix sp. PCC 7507]AFY32530.1 glycosyl transferase family 2 [Calothrix sp. PCC 7507]